MNNLKLPGSQRLTTIVTGAITGTITGTIGAGLAIFVSLTTASCTSRTVLEETKSVRGALTAAQSVQGITTSPEMKIWLVQPKDQTLNLVSVPRRKGKSDDLKEAVEELLRGPTAEEANHGLSTEIPKGTVLISVTNLPDGVVLNMSRRFALSDGGASMETRLEQLKRTVVEPAGEKKVYLDVEGQRLTTASDEGLEVMQPIN